MSKNVINYWPAANRPGEGPTLFNNYFRTGKRVSDTYTWVGRIGSPAYRETSLVRDASCGPTLRRHHEGLGEENAAFPAQSLSDNPRRSGLISLTSTFTPSLLGELRVSYTRFGYNDSWDREGFDISTLGFPQSLANDVQYKTFPTISVSQYTVGTGLSVTGGSSAEVGDLGRRREELHAAGHLSASISSDLSAQSAQVQDGSRSAIFAPVDVQHDCACQPLLLRSRLHARSRSIATKLRQRQRLASLLLGFRSPAISASVPPLRIYGRYYGFYFQDDVQITSKLTANLGLRYEYTTPWAEKWGRVGYFDFNATEPVTGAKGTYVRLQPGQYIYDPQKNNWSPRVGFAYRRRRIR